MYGVHDSLWEDHFNNSNYTSESRGGYPGPKLVTCRYCGKADLKFGNNKFLIERVKGTWVKHECDFSKLLEASCSARTATLK
jgi:hypothetical protein